MNHQRSRDKSSKLLDEEIFHDKDINIVVECICPKCGVKHIMNFPWTGKGTPRKFCVRCKV